MFQQKNQCQHRLNCVLPYAHNCQTIAEITNGYNFITSCDRRKPFHSSKHLLQENISGTDMNVIFHSGSELMRHPGFRPPHITAQMGRLQEEAANPCKDVPYFNVNIAPALSPMGSVHQGSWSSWSYLFSADLTNSTCNACRMREPFHCISQCRPVQAQAWERACCEQDTEPVCSEPTEMTVSLRGGVIFSVLSVQGLFGCSSSYLALSNEKLRS